MFDKELVLTSLENIRKAIEMILDRVSVVSNPDDFLKSAEGMMRLDAICMNLIALGEAVKGLEKLTQGKLLAQYPEVYWSGIMRMRDKIAHHYFEIDTEVVFRTIQEDIPQLVSVVAKIIKDVKNQQADK